jgi:hypothetical protein
MLLMDTIFGEKCQFSGKIVSYCQELAALKIKVPIFATKLQKYVYEKSVRVIQA